MFRYLRQIKPKFYPDILSKTSNIENFPHVDTSSDTHPTIPKDWDVYSDDFLEKMDEQLDQVENDPPLTMDPQSGKITDHLGIFTQIRDSMGGKDSDPSKIFSLSELSELAKSIDHSKLPKSVQNGEFMRRLASQSTNPTMEDDELNTFLDVVGVPRRKESPEMEIKRTKSSLPESITGPGMKPEDNIPPTPEKEGPEFLNAENMDSLHKQLTQIAKILEDPEKMKIIGGRLHEHELKRANEDPVQAFNIGLEHFTFDNFEKARLFFSIAAQADHPKALFYMSKIFYMDKDFESAKLSLIRSAKALDSEACLNLAGSVYIATVDNEEIQQTKSSTEKSATNSTTAEHPDTTTKLFHLMNNLLLLSAQSGNATAMGALGSIYYKIWRIYNSFGSNFDWESYDSSNPSLPSDSYMFDGSFETSGESTEDIRFPTKFHKYLLNPPLPDPTEPMMSPEIIESPEISLSLDELDDISSIQKSDLPDLLKFSENDTDNDSTAKSVVNGTNSPSPQQLEKIRKAAWSFFQNSARAGDSAGFFGLGFMTLNGHGESPGEEAAQLPSITVARNYFRQAANLKSPIGSAYYAGLQWYGLGGSENKQIALRIFRSSDHWISNQMVTLGEKL